MYSRYSSVIAFDELPDPTDRYELSNILGEGTYGSVYKAVDKQTGTLTFFDALELIALFRS
jgi:myosin-3